MWLGWSQKQSLLHSWLANINGSPLRFPFLSSDGNNSSSELCWALSINTNTDFYPCCSESVIITLVVGEKRDAFFCQSEATYFHSKWDALWIIHFDSQAEATFFWQFWGEKGAWFQHKAIICRLCAVNGRQLDPVMLETRSRPPPTPFASASERRHLVGTMQILFISISFTMSLHLRADIRSVLKPKGFNLVQRAERASGRGVRGLYTTSRVTNHYLRGGGLGVI